MSIGLPDRTTSLPQLPKPQLGVSESLRPGQIRFPSGPMLATPELTSGIAPFQSAISLEQERLLLFLENLGLIEIRPFVAALMDSVKSLQVEFQRFLPSLPGVDFFRFGKEPSLLFAHYSDRPLPLYALLEPEFGLAVAAAERPSALRDISLLQGSSGTAVMADKLSQAVSEIGKPGISTALAELPPAGTNPYASPAAGNTVQGVRKEAAGPRTMRRTPPRPVAYRRRSDSRRPSSNPFSGLGRALLNLLAVFRRR